MTDEELVGELTRRARVAGEAAGVYLESAAPAGTAEGLQVVARYRVGDRAFLPAADVAAIERRRTEIDLLEWAVGGDDRAALEAEAAEVLGELGEGW